MPVLPRRQRAFHYLTVPFVILAIDVCCVFAMNHRSLRPRWCCCANVAIEASLGVPICEAFRVTACGPRTVRGRNFRGSSFVKLFTFATTRYFGRGLNDAALSVLNANFPSSECMSKRRKQGVSLVYCFFFINSILSLELWQVTGLQTERSWRCDAVVLLIHQATTYLPK